MFASVDVSRIDRQARDYGYIQTAAPGVWSLIPENEATAGLTDAEPSARTAAEIEAFAEDPDGLTDAAGARHDRRLRAPDRVGARPADPAARRVRPSPTRG